VVEGEGGCWGKQKGPLGRGGRRPPRRETPLFFGGGGEKKGGAGRTAGAPPATVTGDERGLLSQPLGGDGAAWEGPASRTIRKPGNLPAREANVLRREGCARSRWPCSSESWQARAGRLPSRSCACLRSR